MALRDFFEDIADAIRYVDGTSDPIPAPDFPARIRALKNGHISPEVISITWDGDTTGKVIAFEQTQGSGTVTLCKVSDLILTDDEIKRGTLTIDTNGEITERAVTWAEMTANGFVTDDVVISDIFAFVRTAGAEFNGITFPETGIYFAKMTSNGAAKYPSGFTTIAGAAGADYVVGNEDVTEIAASRYAASAVTEANFTNVTAIGEKAFAKCIYLTRISFPSLVNTSSAYLFDGCSSLTDIDMPLLEGIGQDAFRGCSALERVGLPKLKVVKGFAGCTNLSQVDMPVAYEVGNMAFSKCTSLKSITLPNVQRIEYRAFINCTSLEVVDLPRVTIDESANVRQFIGMCHDAFSGCSSLHTLILRNTTRRWSSFLGGVTGDYGKVLTGTPLAEGNGYIYVPRDLMDDYLAYPAWAASPFNFRALEDYTVDGTTTGDLDPNKI